MCRKRNKYKPVRAPYQVIIGLENDQSGIARINGESPTYEQSFLIQITLLSVSW